MKRYWLGVVLTCMVVGGNAQVHDPVKWSFDSKQVGENLFDLRFTSTIEDHWHIYSTTLSPDEGPVPTSFDFLELNGAELVGGVKEPKPVKEYDPNFEMDLLFFGDRVTFTQRVKTSKPNTTISGELTYMVCDDSKCLPPEYLDFSFDLIAEAYEKSTPANAPPAEENKSTKPKNEPEPSPTEEAQLLINENPSQSQVFNPVAWDFKAEKISDGIYEIVLTAKIDEGWHLYSQNLPSEDGPVATEIQVLNDSDFVIMGTPSEEGDLIKEYDKNFMMDLAFYEHDVTFRQKVQAKSTGVFKGEVYFMVCDDSKCLPPEAVEFELNLKGFEGSKSTPEVNEGQSNNTKLASKKITNKSFWEIFLLAFISGFAALLTPCVFPMIPMTVSFFTKQSKTRAQGIKNAILYAISIIVIYVLLGTVVTAIFGSEALNELATNVWFNLFFFVLLVVFAISFLGAFEIVLPSSWVNAADRGADKGGFIGIFFMAFTLALVSFSCTGPIVGTIIVEAASKGGIMPIIGMFGFSLAIALPFALFAAFPGWLNSLPQSGGWLNSVKVVLGFLELAFAMKFLSNADLVVEAWYIPREVFLAVWIAIAGMLGFYLLGKIRLPHDSPTEKLSVGRAMLAMFVFAFMVYIIPGMWGAPLKLVAGILPPMYYSEAPGGSFSGSGSGGSSDHENMEEGQHLGPQGLAVFHELQSAKKYAKKHNKPLFLDFTGKVCANCRKMEEDVWSKPEIKKLLRDDLVIVSLYVDFREKLPKEEQREIMVAGRKRKIKTVGDKWMAYEIEHYGTNSQPYYIMLGPNGEDLANGPADYDNHRDPEDFKAWLNHGLSLFKEAQ